MKACKSIAARHDRGLFHRFLSSSSQTGWFKAWRGGLSSWFQSPELAAGQSGLELMNRWFLGAWRCQPIPLVDCTRYPATKHLRPWGHVVRI
jgi:hypothetical protein